MSTIEASGISYVVATPKAQGSLDLGGAGLASSIVTPFAQSSSFVSGQGLAEILVTPLLHLVQQPKVSLAEPITATKIRVTFDRGMLDNAALINLANYSAWPSTPEGAIIYLISVIQQQIPEPTWIELTTTEHTDDEEYTVAVETGATGPVDSEGVHLDSVHAAAGYDAIGIDPTIESVVSISENEVEVIFNELMEDNTAIRDINRYSFDKGLNVLAVQHVAADTVTLVTDDQTPSVLYTLTVTQP